MTLLMGAEPVARKALAVWYHAQHLCGVDWFSHAVSGEPTWSVRVTMTTIAGSRQQPPRTGGDRCYQALSYHHPSRGSNWHARLWNIIQFMVTCLRASPENILPGFDLTDGNVAWPTDIKNKNVLQECFQPRCRKSGSHRMLSGCALEEDTCGKTSTWIVFRQWDIIYKH